MWTSNIITNAKYVSHISDNIFCNSQLEIYANPMQKKPPCLRDVRGKRNRYCLSISSSNSKQEKPLCLEMCETNMSTVNFFLMWSTQIMFLGCWVPFFFNSFFYRRIFLWTITFLCWSTSETQVQCLVQPISMTLYTVVACLNMPNHFKKETTSQKFMLCNYNIAHLRKRKCQAAHATHLA